MIQRTEQYDPLGCKIAAEIRANGPGTPKQIAEAIDANLGSTIRKLIGMEKDGELVVFRAKCGRYPVFGFANW